MRLLSTFFIALIIIGCKKNHEGISECLCINSHNTDSIISAVNLKFEEGKLSYNCASIETAMASITNLDGNEVCENINDLICKSNTRFSRPNSKNVKYFNDDDIIILKSEEDKNVLKIDFKNPKNFFEITLNKKQEINSITKKTFAN